MRKMLIFLALIVSPFGCGTSTSQELTQEKGAAATAQTVQEKVNDKVKNDAVELFDGETLSGWETIEFGGEGEVEVIDGSIVLNSGDPLTGICVTEDVELPKSDYEVSLEGKKVDGSDFFCALTFPVNETFCTLVVGGWGGTLVGLSNLDGQDASGNDTKLNMKFERDRWYRIKVRVLQKQISVWIDDKQVIDRSIDGVEVGIRADVVSTTPLGITSFMTTSAIRGIKVLKLEGK